MKFRLVVFAAIMGLTILQSCSGDNRNQMVKYTSSPGGFTVLFPGSPKLTDKTEVTPFGKQVVHFVSWRPSAVAIYKIKLFEVSYTACPASLMNDTVMLGIMLDSSIKMRQKDFIEKDIHIESIELNGYQGRSFIYEIPHANSIAIVKQCIVNNRKYDLTVIATTNQGTNPEISEFFNSFQVLQ